MESDNKLLPQDGPFLPQGSAILLGTHLTVSIFFIFMYFAFRDEVETLKAMILVYYTVFNIAYLFFYHSHLRVRRVFMVWSIIACLQMIFYLFNINNLLWGKWALQNALSVLSGVPVTLLLYYIFRRMSLKSAGQDLEIGVRTMYKPTKWDKAATVGIPLVTLLVSLF